MLHKDFTIKKTIIDEIKEIKERQRFNDASSEISTRLFDLEKALSKIDTNDELLKYFPIALIATIESSCRILIAELIDQNHQCFNNAEKLLKSYKIDFNVIKALYGKEITFGNFIAHVISINNIEQLHDHISTLIEKKFLMELETHFSRWDIEIRKIPKKPMLDNSSETYKNISKTFELRHIFAHETATNIQITLKQVEDLFQSCVSFLNTSSDYINDFIHPNAPLTQTEMNIYSANKYEEIFDDLEELNAIYKKILRPERQQEYETVEQAWKNFMHLQAEFEANEYKGGTIMPLIYNTIATTITEERKKYLENLIKYADK